MAKKESKEKYLLFIVVGFVLGILAAIAVTNPPGSGSFYKKAVIILYDSKCDVCMPDLNRTVRFMENNLSSDGIQFIWQDVERGAGKRRYETLAEKNVNVVPLILFTKDLEGTEFFKELNESLAAQGGLSAKLIDLGDYYALRPSWPTRRYVPGKDEVTVNVYADKNVDITTLKKILYMAADNVVVDVHETNEVVLRVEGPEEVIRVLGAYYPLSRITSTVLEVPKITAVVFARPEFAGPVEQRLEAAGIPTEVNTTLYGTYVLANIVTGYPDVVGKLFPGAKYYPNGLSLTREEVLNIDLFLAGNEDEWIKELNEIVARTKTEDGYRVSVAPHYIAGMQGQTIVFPGGQEAFNRAVIEYCAFLNGPVKWVEFASAFRECGGSENCIDASSEDANVDAEFVKNCASTSANQILQFFINDAARNGLTKTSAIINGWLYVDSPDRLKDYVCAMLSFPPEELCGGE